MVIVLVAHAAVTPVGKPVGAPIPVAPVVVCVIGVSTTPTHKVGDDDAAVTVLFALTVMVAGPPPIKAGVHWPFTALTAKS